MKNFSEWESVCVFWYQNFELYLMLWRICSNKYSFVKKSASWKAGWGEPGTVDERGRETIPTIELTVNFGIPNMMCVGSIEL